MKQAQEITETGGDIFALVTQLVLEELYEPSLQPRKFPVGQI